MSDPHQISPLRYAFGAVAVTGAAAIAACALVGGMVRAPMLSGFGPGLPAMPANAAVALLAASLSWLAVHSSRPALRRLGLGLAALVAALSAAMLAQRLLGVDLGIDQALVRDPSAADGQPGRAPVAVCVALLCAAAALALTRRTEPIAEDLRQIVRLLGLAISLFAVALYVSEPATLGVIEGFETFALNAALALALLFLAIGFDRSSASLRWQVAHLGVVVIAPLAALTVHFASSEREIALQNAGARLAGIAQLGVERQDAVIEQMRKILLYLARAAAVRGGGPICEQELRDYANLNPATRTLYVVDRGGMVRCSDVAPLIGMNLGDRDYVQEAFATQSFTVSNLFFARASKRPRIAAALPIVRPDGAPVLLATGIDLAAFGDPLERLAAEADPHATMTLVDGRGVVLARYPADPALVGASIADASFVTQGLASPGAIFEAAEIDGRATVFFARRHAFGEGTLIVGLPKSDVVGPVDARMNGRLAFICLVLIASIAFGTLGGEALVLRPLRRLTAYAGRMEAGDMSARPDVDARGEVGALGRALAVMAGAVEDRERRLAGAEALFRGLFDHSPDANAVVLVEPDGGFIVETWNAAAARASGRPVERVVGRTPRAAFGAPGELMEGDLARAAALRGALRVERELTIEGVPASYEIVHVPLRDADGRVTRLFVSARDISERKRVERLKNEFVSTVSHELRTPLTSIAGSLGLLAGGAAGSLGDKAVHLITIAHSNSLRLVRLINDILDIEKIESGRMAFEMTPVTVLDIVEQAAGGLKGYADDFGVLVEIAAEGGEAVVRGDSDRLTQVVTNLVSNAIKFSPRDGVVTVTVAAEDELVSLTVRDRGAGIPEAFRTRIFTKFAQADGSDSRRKGGTGLGLAIVKEIVERHAGAVGYRTTPGAGSEFYVRLPRYRSRATPAAPAYAEAGARPLVLICEDDALIATILAEQLDDAGFASIVVGTMRAALDAAASAAVDAVLVDLHLPDGDGISLIRDLQASPRHRGLPIIVVSAEAQRGRADARAALLDVVAWLDKPIDAGRLASVLRDRLADRPSRPRVLHVEDDADLRKVVSAAIVGLADVVSVASLREARAAIAEAPFDLAIIDVTLNDGSGLDLLRALETQSPQRAPVVIFSAHDIDRDVAAKVEAALTKSRTSLMALVDTVGRLIAERRKEVEKAAEARLAG